MRIFKYPVVIADKTKIDGKKLWDNVVDFDFSKKSQFKIVHG